MQDAELRYWVAFNRINGIGSARFNALITFFGDLAHAWNASETDLARAVGDARAVASIVKARRTADIDSDLAMIGKFGAYVITLYDAEYPALLRQVDNPPPLLYVRGTLLESDQRALAIVGTRSATSYGVHVAQHFTNDLVRAGFTIISGLAKGIDTAAHQAAIQGEGRTIAFLGHGIDRVYPAANSDLAMQITEHGALVTEFPIGTPPDGNNFPIRNRLISGASLGVLLVEAQLTSGAIGTARLALDQGREVFAVPGNIYTPESQGPHLMIQAGEAKLITGVADILAEFELSQPVFELASAAPQDKPPRRVVSTNRIAAPLVSSAPKLPPDPPANPPEPLNDLESALLACMGREPCYVDDLCIAMNWPPAQVTMTLTLLELRGIIEQQGAMRYVLADP